MAKTSSTKALSVVQSSSAAALNTIQSGAAVVSNVASLLSLSSPDSSRSPSRGHIHARRAHTTVIDSVLEDEELLPGFDGGGGTRVHALDLMEMDYDL